MEKLNVTAVPNKEKLSDYASVTIESSTIASFYNDNDYEVDGDTNAVLFASAFNTYKTTGLSSSQLLQQNRQLVEALRTIRDSKWNDGEPFYERLADVKIIADKAISTHQKDV
jgi:hypothetical protein